MKKNFLLTLIFAMVTIAVFAQVPASFNYQAVVRNSSGEILANKTVSFRISLLQGSESGAVLYSEKHSLSTNEFGLINLKIGKGTKLSGDFSPADWGEVIFTKIEIDPAGGSSFSHLATTKLSSVPFAIKAQTVVNDKVDDADADPANEIQTLSLNGTLLELSNGGGSVTLPTSGGSGGDNWGAQVVKTDETLTGDGTSGNELHVVADGDGDDTNELQTLSVSGNDLTISGGNTVALPNSSLWSQTGDKISYDGAVGIGVVPDYNAPSLDVRTTADMAAIYATNNSAANPPLQVYNQNANGAAAWFRNKIAIQDGTQGEGKVLTSDATGNTSWQTPATGGGSLWTQDGNGIFYNNGSVAIGTGTQPNVLLNIEAPEGSEPFVVYSNGSAPAIYADNFGGGLAANFQNKIKINDGTQLDGRVLTCDADGVGSWKEPASSLWTESGDDVYRSSGKVGIGTTTPEEKLHVADGNIQIDEGHQLKLSHTTSYSIIQSTGNNLLIGSFSGGKIDFSTNTNGTSTGYTRLSIAANGDIEVKKNLSVDGTTSIKNTLSVDGATTLKNTLSIDGATSILKSLTVNGTASINDNTTIGKDLIVNGGNFDLNSTGENWLSVLRGNNQNAGIAFKEVGAAKTQWIFPYFRGWQSDNLIVRDEAAGKDVMTFEAATGKVGIGTSPTATLDVNGTVRFRGITSGSQTTAIVIDSDGNLHSNSSDRRLKENIQPLNNSLDKILKLRGVSFTWKANPEYGKRIGFIAQEFEKVIPELSFTNPVDGYKGINYAEVTAVLVEAVKEQQKIINELKETNKQLQADNSNIANRLDKIEQMLSATANK